MATDSERLFAGEDLSSRDGCLHPRSFPAMAGAIENLVHVTPWLSRQGGGIPPVVWNLARQAMLTGINCSVAGLHDQWINEDCAAQKVPFVTGAIKGPGGFGFSPSLSAQVRRLVTPGSVVHSHGLWMYPGIIARECARNAKCPLVVSPHGMLEPWALNRSHWKKQLAAWMFEDDNLHRAGCLHALCRNEAENLRRYRLRNPIAIIPNGVDLNEFYPWPDADAITQRFPQVKNRRRVLFLSRLHPKKGLENLLMAWRKLAADFEDWCLLVGGSGEPEYEQRLKSIVEHDGMGKSVFFLGPVYGDAKKEALAAADVFVLPSFSEGFSMAILEAAAAGLPVVFTRECNFPELAKAGAGIETSANSGEIEASLRQVIAMSGETRKSMGQRGKKLVQKSYTWPAVATQMLEVYQWLAGNASKPGIVELS
jgi:glycosyltransferase involved in cell wall biosynthesis